MRTLWGTYRLEEIGNKDCAKTTDAVVTIYQAPEAVIYNESVLNKAVNFPSKKDMLHYTTDGDDTKFLIMLCQMMAITRTHIWLDMPLMCSLQNVPDMFLKR